MNRAARKQARELWAAGDLMKAGHRMYESLSRVERPAWAARVLAVVVAAVDAPGPVKAVLELARDEARWGEARAAFDAVRTLTLLEGRAGAKKNLLLLAVLYLAENCAKVTYNATQPPAPFDADAGWWIPECARAVLDQLPALERDLEQALFG